MSIANELRPSSLKDFIGPAGVIHTIKCLLEKDQFPHVSIILGPSGCGKTSLARIIANHITNGSQIAICEKSDYMNPTAIAEGLMFCSQSETKKKVFILNEVYASRRDRWVPLLPIIEEPKEHQYIIICAYSQDDIPIEVFSRCAPFQLKKLTNRQVSLLLHKAAITYNYGEGDKMAESIDRITDYANGNIRLAYNLLETYKDNFISDEDYPVLKTLGKKIRSFWETGDKVLTWKELDKIEESINDSPEIKHAVLYIVKTEAKKVIKENSYSKMRGISYNEFLELAYLPIDLPRFFINMTKLEKAHE